MLAGQHLSIAGQQRDRAALSMGYRNLAISLLCLGELPKALEQMDKALARYNPEQHRAMTVLYGLDPGPSGLCYKAFILWHLGYPDRALYDSDKAVDWAREHNHLNTLALCINYNLICHCNHCNVVMVEERAHELSALAEGKALEFWQVWSKIFLGWVAVEKGDHEAGLAQLRKSLGDSLLIGSRFFRTYHLGLFAEACARLGRAEEGLDALDEALEIVTQSHDHHWEAEIQRLKGTLLLVQSVDCINEAQACYKTAIKIAQGRSTARPAGRAATPMARPR